jgi:hypothetical protein
LLPTEESCLAAGEACGRTETDDETLIARITELVLEELRQRPVTGDR